MPYKNIYGLGWEKVKTKLVPHGIAKEYHESGVLKKEGPYLERVRDGILKFYDGNGSLEMNAGFKDGNLTDKRSYQ